MSRSDKYIPVRLSHLVRYYSVGSIIRGPQYLITPKDTREWTDRNGNVAARLIPYVDQVRSALGIEQELREPPIAKELDNGEIDGICVPAIRFPSWMRCPGCELLYCQPWRQKPESSLLCTRCGKKPLLEQMPWVFVHQTAGHMADVPWHYLTHSNAVTRDRKQCRADWNEPYLKLMEQTGSGRKLECERCRATAIFRGNERFPYGKRRIQPWLKESIEGYNDDPEHRNEIAVVLSINDARVHIPETHNALVIPPESRIRKGTVVDRLYGSSKKRKEIDQTRSSFQKKSLLRRFADEFRCTEAEINNAAKEIKSGYPLYGQHTTPGLLLEKEYQALIDPIPDLFDDEDFVTRHRTEEWKKIKKNLKKGSQSESIVNAVSRLIAVDRLKELLVFQGFRRLDQSTELVPPDIVGKSDWLPALELYGEGIFFTIKEKLLQKWEKNSFVQSRAVPLRQRFERSGYNFEPAINVTPRFLLLHTLSHILIRKLEAEAGYPAASLKERIYCKTGKKPMSGILIYVAVPDIEGSLGGLSELSKPQRFLKILTSVFDHAQWCSLDPVCSEHEGQGPNLLNRAACHGCALIPESSCAYRNILLDRWFIKGDPPGKQNPVPFFLNKEIN